MILRSFRNLLCWYRIEQQHIGKYIYFQRCMNRMSSEVTAGVLIIGDEILKGITEDVNTPFLIKRLNESGIQIRKISMLPDDVEIISQEVLQLTQKCSVVLTSGGIGPTHDDVTYEAVAKALNEDLLINEELSKLFVSYFGSQSLQNPAIMKFSSIPKSAVLNYADIKYRDKKLKFPLVSVKNVYMFPGVPMLLQKSFEIFKNSFLLHNKPYFTRNIFITLDEFSVTALLNDAVKKFDGVVKFGSYPTFNDNYYKVKLVLESNFEESIQEACNYFKVNLPDGGIVNIKQNVLLSAVEDVYKLSKTSSSVLLALSMIEQVLKKYSLSEVCFCFNGGKDCTALLHLFYSCVQKIQPEAWCHVQFLYVKNEDFFREVDSFVQDTVKRYCLNLATVKGDLKDATCHFLETHPRIKCVLMGTRKCDPGATDLTYFSPTDGSWPIVMRILPVLDWSYSDVWSFIRELQLPYCSLYDHGYTSLGAKSKTVQNPSLLYVDHRGHKSYKPAYMLGDMASERNGRL